MRIYLACPAPAGSRRGNRVTAQRWRAILRGLGHRVAIGEHWAGEACDLMVALHARKSHPSMAAYRAAHPRQPLILCLTGTDLYHDLQTSAAARQSLEWADRIVVLHAKAAADLPADGTGPASFQTCRHVRDKVRVIRQSLPAPRIQAKTSGSVFDVCVLGHLRDEKDPLRAALALRFVPQSVPIRVTHAGQALTRRCADHARRLMEHEPRYRWLGEVPRGRARRILARSHAMVMSSRMEGGANVVSEAIVLGVPVLASYIPGNVGLLGDDWPAYYPVGDTRALAELIVRTATSPDFQRDLRDRLRLLAPLFHPDRERAAWRNLLAELNSGGTP
jgi:putative glycosyltransferase (TIGR04348 family)